mmetsp:Transcript_11482/g.46498  ORF Transcript_11482/g.46498 Transcript_11482/m.46498 type:complete len:271 (+) Transcript_11482:862-1674(+)
MASPWNLCWCCAKSTENPDVVDTASASAGRSGIRATAALKNVSACGRYALSSATWPRCANNANRRNGFEMEGAVTWQYARHAFANSAARRATLLAAADDGCCCDEDCAASLRFASLRAATASFAVSSTRRSRTGSRFGNAARHSTKMPSCRSRSRPMSILSTKPTMRDATWRRSPSGESESSESCATRAISSTVWMSTGSLKTLLGPPSNVFLPSARRLPLAYETPFVSFFAASPAQHPARSSLAISTLRWGRNRSSSLSRWSDARMTDE